MGPYDVGAAFAAIEDELTASMMRNMERHRVEEVTEERQWAMWQAMQIKALERYRRRNRKKYGSQFQDLNRQIGALIRQARDTGGMEQEIAMLRGIQQGYRFPHIPERVLDALEAVDGGSLSQKIPELIRSIRAGRTDPLAGGFFRLNERKLEALVKATTHDMEKAETAVLRMADDQYRRAIFNAQVYANTGAGTYEKAVDMATKDMLAAGLNCVEYKNGARHTLSDYADMAIRTACKRAYLQGEGAKRQEWGISTVIMNKRGDPCPKCLPFCGKVLIDDVWSGGSRKDGPYPLMSAAIAAGLYHPRCKDSHTTYFPGVSTADDTWTKEELGAVEKVSKREAKQQYAKRQEERFGRLARYSLDAEDRAQYQRKVDMWKHVYFKTGGMDSREYAEVKDAARIKGFSDVTEEWLATAMPDLGEIISLTEYTVNGITYKVDGKHVLLDHTDREMQVAELLKRELGGQVSMVPRVLSPQGVSTPDYIFRSESFDLKELSGKSKNLVYNAISKKKRQASNFILDISQCPLTENEIYKQVDYIYWSRHTGFVDKIILLKGDKLLRIFERSK